MGVRLTYTTNSALQPLKHKPTSVQPKGSVYVVNCSTCPKVYVAQTGKMVEDEPRQIKALKTFFIN